MPPRPALAALTTRRADASPRLVLVVVCAGMLVANLDLFIVNVALPTVGRELHAHDLPALSWVLNAYAIVYAALLVLFGRLAESRRRDQAFLLGAAVFTVASAACGLAPNLPALIAFRVVQAAGAALLTPSSLGLLLACTPAERRHGAVRTWTATSGFGGALGPVVGGLLIGLSWRWVFLVNVPIGVVALAVGWRRLPRVDGHPAPRADVSAAALVTAGVSLLALALVRGGGWGWGSSATLGTLAASLLALGGFALHCARHPNPLVDGRLFAVRAFRGSSLVSLVFSTAFGAMLLSRVLFAEDVWHWSALHTGLTIAPGPIMVPLFSFLVAGRLITRFGAGAVIAVGATLFAGGELWWLLATTLTPDFTGAMLGGMLITGIGVGLTLPTFMATGAAALPDSAFATGSAVLNMLRQVGLAVGVALLIAVLGSPRGGHAALDAYRRGWVVTGAAGLLSAAIGAWTLRRRSAVTSTAAG